MSSTDLLGGCFNYVAFLAHYSPLYPYSLHAIQFLAVLARHRYRRKLNTVDLCDPSVCQRNACWISETNPIDYYW